MNPFYLWGTVALILISSAAVVVHMMMPLLRPDLDRNRKRPDIQLPKNWKTSEERYGEGHDPRE